ncbi:hypothetical protein ORI20_25530 [Mycobacterium sp. CVI_P3]|uniref:DUF559 domain-containing protein n=1 Tax=Mycobacterium pinniadriaticum TaxID=2994102 RepID=A0ABT3SL27_9MYCO|nr:hypothetical protein [Mycobacterium pinniadriaticum]MCX2933636.1 hypothetical protein [Mycobacterium pinniadriaticum]MCX2940077.1 hypothetical protein [Mycobacterium pinniadriaticum]
MRDELAALFDRQDGVATAGQILALVSRGNFNTLLECAAVERIWRGIYSRGAADRVRRLKGLDLACGEAVAVCMGTAAHVHGFDTEGSTDLHVVNPNGHQLRPADGLVVHRRDGAPLVTVSGRPATAPAWTAVEVARTLRRPRALATLDAALRSRSCDLDELAGAVVAQQGRRGIVKVRQLVPLADGRAESPMESEARLVMIDGGLPNPVLQHEVVDARGRLRRLDFAWPEHRVAAEYDSGEWHVGADALRRDREKLAALQDLGWMVVPIVVDDVRRQPSVLVNRIGAHLASREYA